MAEKYIQQALFDYLRADNDIKATAISTRSYWEEAPNQASLTYPYLVFTLVSDTVDPWALSSYKTANPRISITVYTKSKSDESIIRLILNKLRYYTGSMQSLTITTSRVTAYRAILDDETKIWMFGFDWLPIYEVQQ